MPRKPDLNIQYLNWYVKKFVQDAKDKLQEILTILDSLREQIKADLFDMVHMAIMDPSIETAFSNGTDEEVDYVISELKKYKK